MSLPEISFDLAFAWTCPACNRRNFVDGVTPCKEEQDNVLRDMMGLESWESVEGARGDTEGGFLMQPTRVQCRCGDHFKVQL